MDDRIQIVVLTLMAGMTMPIGAAIAGIEHIHSRWLETELRHSVIAFGGGALLAAIALVLVPEGVRDFHPLMVVVCFAGGGVAFMVLDIKLASNATPASQLVAMISDFVPEALAMGATFIHSKTQGMLLAGIIALQNLPEGFNACREVMQSTHYRWPKVAGAFAVMALLGPASGLAGYFFLSTHPRMVSGIMLFSAGGILYLIFQDIAPQSQLKQHWAPPLGAVAGYLVGVLGQIAIAP